MHRGYFPDLNQFEMAHFSSSKADDSMRQAMWTEQVRAAFFQFGAIHIRLIAISLPPIPIEVSSTLSVSGDNAWSFSGEISLALLACSLVGW